MNHDQDRLVSRLRQGAAVFSVGGLMPTLVAAQDACSPGLTSNGANTVGHGSWLGLVFLVLWVLVRRWR